MPTLKVKRICPAAASHTFAFKSALKSGFHRKPNPFETFQSGCAGIGAPSVITLTAIIIANIKRTGRANLHNLSIPPFIPW